MNCLKLNYLSRLHAMALLVLASVSTDIAAQDAVLETVAIVDEAPGNIAVGSDSTVFITIHPILASEHLALAIRDAQITPFPNETWSLRQPEDGSAPLLQPSLGVRADRDGLVWMLANGREKHLYAWDVHDQRLAHDFTFGNSAPAVARSSFNDIALALDHGVVFLSDSSGDDSALIALDIASGDTRRLLDGHPSMRPEPITASIEGIPLGSNGPDGQFRPFGGGLNPLTIDAREEWVYYGAMSGQWVYRIRVEDLLDESLDEAALGEKVERYAAKPASAGITVDDAGNIYVADFQNQAIGVASPGQDYRILVQDSERLSWPDGISVGPDGYVYTANNYLQRNFDSHRHQGRPAPPYYVTRVKALAPTSVGR